MAAEALQRIEAHKRLEAEQLCIAVDNVATNTDGLYGLSLKELEEAANKDWFVISADSKMLKIFAFAVFTKKQRELGKIPEHYTSKTVCKRCGTVSVPKGLENGGHVLGCMWCITPLGRC